MNGFVKILSREFKRILTSKDLIVICLLAPFIYFYGLSYIYEKQVPKDIKISIVDQDNSSVSRLYNRIIDATPELNINSYYSSTHSAYNAIFKNETDIFYFIPKDFSENLKRGKSTFAFIGANASNFMISSSAIKTIVMTSQYLSAQILVKMLIKNGISKQTAISMQQPLKTNFKWIFNPAKTYSNFLIPFLIFAVFQQILIVAVCHTMSLETEQNTWKDLYKISDGKIMPILFGKAVPYIFVALYMTAIFIFLIFPFADIYNSSKINLFILSAIYALVIVFFAMMISHLFKTPVISLCTLTFYSMPVLLISGFAWPLYMLPPYLKIAAHIFPSTYFINTFRFYSLNDMPLSYASGCIINLIIFFLVCLSVNIIVFKRKKYF